MSAARVGAIVLAAGESRRMGTQKVLLPFAGRTVLEHIVRELRAGGIGEIVVVTGKDAGAIEARLSDAGVAFAHNASYSEGMLSSVRVGLRAAPAEWAAACLALGDQPSIRGETVAALVEAFAAEPTRIVRPTFDERGGHPMVIPMSFAPEIGSDFDDVGLRGLLARHAERVVNMPVGEAGVLRDMDYPEDYRREVALWERSRD